MFRTRDFLLFSIITAFLVLGIITTINVNGQSSWLKVANFINNDVEYKAIVPEVATLNREENLSKMREKIAQASNSGNLASVATASLEEEVKDEEGKDEEVIVIGKIDKCTHYNDMAVAWSAVGLKFEVVEGARIVYRDLAYEAATLGSEMAGASREIVAQLPLRSIPTSVQNCLGSSVVGIALDGSLINNSDYTAYKIFGAETLIGYALDGFPIYGLNDTADVDQCGGSTEGSQYRYYLSSDREGMIGCFSGDPISL